jgi:S-formylglutathione hydrolase FrmB
MEKNNDCVVAAAAAAFTMGIQHEIYNFGGKHSLLHTPQGAF